MPGDFPVPLEPAPDANSVVMEGTGTVTIPDQSAPVNDTWTVRLVVLFLGMVVIAIIIASCVLALKGDKELPDTLIALASVSVGALAGLLASTASKRT